MFGFDQERLQQMGAAITTAEIKQQPELWQEAFHNYELNLETIDAFFAQLFDTHKKVRVILTGAGTSAYVGETITPYIKSVVDETYYDIQDVATTDLVSNPYAFFKADIPTLLVSFARSGNSPESVAAVNLAKQIVKELYQLTITCAPDGQLAQQAEGDDRNLLLLQPARSNDAGFAMTGSFTCMSLTAMLVFDPASLEQKRAWVQAIIESGKEVIDREAELQAIVDLDFNRVIYLGSGSFFGLAHEAQLKILELTAGKIATLYESSMGFRHGPKSFVDEKTILFQFVSNNAYTVQYDQDILAEVAADEIAQQVVAIQLSGAINVAGVRHFELEKRDEFNTMPDAYLALPYIVVGQTIALLSSIKVGNTPDTPSATGTVNRVVKGVIIHPY